MTRYISLLEIVAFESFVTNNSKNEVREIYNTLVSQIRDDFSTIRSAAILKDGHYGVELLFQSKFIILLTDNDSSRALFEIMQAVQTVIPVALAEGFPLIGCINCGNIEGVDALVTGDIRPRNELFLSPIYWESIAALDVAPCCGCLLTGATLENFEEIRTKNTYTIDDMVKLNFLFKMPVEGLNHPAVAINWMADTKMNFSYGFLKSIFTKHKRN